MTKKSRITRKTPETDRFGFVTNVRDMPILLKLIFLSDSYALVRETFALITNQPIAADFFGAVLPLGWSFLWHAYAVISGTFSIYTYLKRSVSVLRIWLIVQVSILAVSVANSLYRIPQYSESVRTTSIFAFAISYGTIALLYMYVARQKHYFNRP